jgi:hypothetical protein
MVYLKERNSEIRKEDQPDVGIRQLWRPVALAREQMQDSLPYQVHDKPHALCQHRKVAFLLENSGFLHE